MALGTLCTQRWTICTERDRLVKGPGRACCFFDEKICITTQFYSVEDLLYVDKELANGHISGSICVSTTKSRTVKKPHLRCISVEYSRQLLIE